MYFQMEIREFTTHRPLLKELLKVFVLTGGNWTQNVEEYARHKDSKEIGKHVDKSGQPDFIKQTNALN